MKQVEINYKWTEKEDYNLPNNNYGEEIESIVVGLDYSFDDYLRDNDVLRFELDEIISTYYILDECDERTGEAYFVISEKEEVVYDENFNRAF